MCVGDFVDSGSPRKGGAEDSSQGREGKGTKNMDIVACPTPTADTLFFFSCKNETNVKMRKIRLVGQ